MRARNPFGFALAPVLAIAAFLAVAGSLPTSLTADNLSDPITWAVAACTAMLVACCLLATAVQVRIRDQSHGGHGRWACLVTALWVAGIMPYAVDSVRHHRLADLSLAALAIAVSCSTPRHRRAVRVITAALATGVACACEATAMLWVIASVAAAIRWKEHRPGTGLVLVCGVTGMVAARLAGWPLTAGYTIDDAAYALHRDLMILMPAVLLGVIGYATARADATNLQFEPAGLRAWTPIAVFALFLIALGVPLDVRLCVLPLLWWTPAGLTELTRITVHRETPLPPPTRAVGLLSGIVLAALAITGVLRLADGPLLAIELFSL